MIISILINPTNAAIESAETNDMSGNTDWIRADVATETAEMLLGHIRDEYGAALFKWVNEAVAERTIEERKKEWSIPEDRPTIDQRMTTAEGNIVDISTALDIILEGRMPE